MSDEARYTDPESDASADPTDIEGWETIGVYPNEEEARFVVDFLRSRDLAAELESQIVHELPVTTGGMGSVRVRVPVDELEAARDLLSRQSEVALAEGEESPTAEGELLEDDGNPELASETRPGGDTAS